MLRSYAIVVSLVCLAAAPVNPPAVDALAEQGYALMRQGDWVKARAPLEKAYLATPANARGRVMVINHAILDMTQKTYVMRAVKDLTTYLSRNRAEDEYATNVLGGVLNVAASDSKIKAGELWQSGYREWQRRTDELDKSRPGYRRWGVNWVTEDDYRMIRMQQEELKISVTAQQQRLSDAVERATALLHEYQGAINSRDAYANALRYLQGYSPFLPGNIYDPNFTQGQYPSSFLVNGLAADAEARRLVPAVNGAFMAVDAEVTKLRELQAQSFLPEWPKKFDVVDSAENVSKPPPTTMGPPKGLIHFGANKPRYGTTQPATMPASESSSRPAVRP